ERSDASFRPPFKARGRKRVLPGHNETRGVLAGVETSGTTRPCETVEKAQPPDGGTRGPCATCWRGPELVSRRRALCLSLQRALQHFRRKVREPRTLATTQGQVRGMLPTLEAIHRVGQSRRRLGQVRRVDLFDVAEADHLA